MYCSTYVLNLRICNVYAYMYILKVNGYFPDGVGSKPWNDTNPQAPMQFINDTENWYSTWDTNGDSALQVRGLAIATDTCIINFYSTQSKSEGLHFPCSSVK
jgi:hypothetical protein